MAMLQPINLQVNQIIRVYKNMKQNLFIIGYGCHYKVVRDVITSLDTFQICGIFDDSFETLCFENGIQYGPIYQAKEIFTKNPNAKFFIAIGNNIVRKKIYSLLQIPLIHYISLIHPSVILGSNITIGHGTIVMPGAVVNADTKIGNHCIINTRAVIEHDNSIGDYVHISPNTALSGNVHVKDGTHIGTGSSVIQNQLIGEWSVVGAGSVVIREIPDFCTAVGVPAVPIKYFNNPEK